jgi:predicted dehydrogenase
MALAEDAEIIAAYSRDQQRAEDFASKHGAQAAYTSVEELLGDSRVDAVYIASPNHLHAPYTKLAAQAGKHVFVEKPMATTAGESVEMIKACNAHGVKLGVGFQLRYHPGHLEARRLVQEGALGEISLVQALLGSGVRGEIRREPRTGLSGWWEEPDMVGHSMAMIGSGVHAVDDLEFMLGQTVVEVAALTDGQAVDAPLEKLAAMSLRFSGGAIGMVCCGSRMPDAKNDVTIYGSDGRVLLADASRPSLEGSLEVASETVNSTVTYSPDPLALVKWQIEGSNQAITLDEEPRASGSDGLRSVQVTEAMIKSARSRRTITVDPIPVN